MTERYLFHVSEEADPTLSDFGLGLDHRWIAICPESHWKSDRCLSDWEISGEIVEALGEEALDGLSEETESMFSYTDPVGCPTRTELVLELTRRGFVQDSAFSAFMERG